MYIIQFTPRADKDIEHVPVNIQKYIRKKLDSNAALPNPNVRAEPPINLPPSTHRFRIGKYRASFHVEENRIIIDRIEIRGSAYQRH